jgi:hypothetical protein
VQKANASAVSQNSRPQPRKKSNPFFSAACTSEKTLLGPQTCERSDLRPQARYKRATAALRRLLASRSALQRAASPQKSGDATFLIRKAPAFSPPKGEGKRRGQFVFGGMPFCAQELAGTLRTTDD